jgi:hypothetical protein
VRVKLKRLKEWFLGSAPSVSAPSVSAPPPSEYIFIDHKRLDCYFDQISTEKFIYEKIPFWTVGLSTSGPKVAGQQQRMQREFTTHEKIAKLVEYVKQNGLVRTRRPRDHERMMTSAAAFRMETCDAALVQIVSRKIQARGVGVVVFPGLSFWLSEAPPPRGPESPIDQKVLEILQQEPDPISVPEEGPLFLMLNDVVEDERGSWAVSSYSAFEMLRRYGGEFLQNILMPEYSPENALVRDFDLRLSADPAKFLAQLGAQVLTKRRIMAFYRVRSSFNVHENNSKTVTLTFGYPIFITALDQGELSSSA